MITNIVHDNCYCVSVKGELCNAPTDRDKFWAIGMFTEAQANDLVVLLEFADQECMLVNVRDGLPSDVAHMWTQEDVKHTMLRLIATKFFRKLAAKYYNADQVEIMTQIEDHLFDNSVVVMMDLFSNELIKDRHWTYELLYKHVGQVFVKMGNPMYFLIIDNPSPFVKKGKNKIAVGPIYRDGAMELAAMLKYAEKEVSVIRNDKGDKNSVGHVYNDAPYVEQLREYAACCVLQHKKDGYCDIDGEYALEKFEEHISEVSYVYDSYVMGLLREHVDKVF